ncbi:hypothetical protein Drorol1_Dr00002925 [Drosera rotundifolia]
MYTERVTTLLSFIVSRAKCPLGSPLLHQEMLLFCMRKLGVHIQDANQCPCFNKLVLTIETVHVADNAKSENVHGLDKEQLESRKVEVIDIASSARDHWSYLVGRCDVDLSKFRSRRTGRGPLTVSWKEQCNPVMTAYKLVTVDAPYWGFGKRLEQTLLAGERALFVETHRSCFAWIDQWYGMTQQQLQDLEQEYYSLTSKEHESLSRSFRETEQGLERRCSLDSEGTFSHSCQLGSKECRLAVKAEDWE